MPHGLVRRAKIILMAGQGYNNKTIAEKVALSPAVIGMWRKRFMQQGLMGLYDEAKPGGPRSITDEQVARLIQKTLNKKPANATHWSCRAVAKTQAFQNQQFSEFGKRLAFNPTGKSILNYPLTRFL